MDAICKLAGVLDAGAFVATFDDDTLVMFARQLVQWKPNDTFESVQRMARLQAEAHGQDLDKYLTIAQQRALFVRLRQVKKYKPIQ